MQAQHRRLQMIVVVALIHFAGVAGGETLGDAFQEADEGSVSDELKGYGRRPTGLVPVYPDGVPVPRLTSLYGSWTDVDGSMRDEAHSGVDGGDHRDDPGDLLVDGHGLRARAGAFAADVEDVGPVADQLHRLGQAALGRHAQPPVRKAVGRDVDDAHDAGAPGHAPPPIRRPSASR